VAQEIAMSRSKQHQPWQPRMSSGDLFNPFSHSAEHETTTLDVYEEDDESEAGRTPASAQGSAEVTADMGQEAERLESSKSATAASAMPQSPWYTRLVGRFTRH
jgi:hypothetical protein